MTTGPSLPLTARCPQCPAERCLPAEWREMLLESMHPEKAERWTGELYCRDGHRPVPMTITENA